MVRTMTIRIPDDQVDELDLIARTLGEPLAEIIRCALADYIAAIRSSGEFAQKLRDRVLAEQEIVSRYVNPKGDQPC
jgi:predicted transcriptional regulator